MSAHPSNSNSLLPVVIGVGCSIVAVIILLFLLFLLIRRRDLKKMRIAGLKVSEFDVKQASLSRSATSIPDTWRRSPDKEAYPIAAECELSTHGGPFELLGRGKGPRSVREWIMETDMNPRLSRPGKSHTSVGARNIARSVRSNMSLPLRPRFPGLDYTDALRPDTPNSAPRRTFTR